MEHICFCAGPFSAIPCVPLRFASLGVVAVEHMAAFAEIILWFFVINLGVAFGAGLYEHQVVVPQWFVPGSGGPHVDSEAMRRTDPGRKFRAGVTTLPLTFLTLASLVCAWQIGGRECAWWLAAATITLVERIATFGFFIPTAIKLVRSETSAAQASSLARQWQPANVVRISLNLVAWLVALKALVLFA